MSDAQLEILASRAGLAVDWIDANGRAQKVGPSVLRAVLTGLGHPAGSAQEIDASLLELLQHHRLPPLMTVDVGAGLDLARYFEPENAPDIHLEDGSWINLKLDAQAVLPGLIPVGYQHVSIDGQSFTLAVAPERCWRCCRRCRRQSDPAHLGPERAAVLTAAGRRWRFRRYPGT